MSACRRWCAELDELAERVDGYGGRIVKSTGDGMLVTFESPRQAVSFALAAQRALVGSVPRVKIGMNTGEADWQDGDPLGAAVNAAARIAARADGGEVLVSDVVRLLTGAVPAFHFLDRGRHRLRGFSERWHLWVVEDRASARHTGDDDRPDGRVGDDRRVGLVHRDRRRPCPAARG